jgi:hypothetical protein
MLNLVKFGLQTAFFYTRQIVGYMDLFIFFVFIVAMRSRHQAFDSHVLFITRRSYIQGIALWGF